MTDNAPHHRTRFLPLLVTCERVSRVEPLEVFLHLRFFSVPSVVYFKCAQCHGGETFQRHRDTNFFTSRRLSLFNWNLERIIPTFGDCSLFQISTLGDKKGAIISGNHHNYYHRKRSVSSCLSIRLQEQLYFHIFLS